jgi:hypothetical protein
MSGRRRPALALGVAALALTASGYAATGGANGTRSNNRPSSPGNGHGHEHGRGHCGHSDKKPPCGKGHRHNDDD